MDKEGAVYTVLAVILGALLCVWILMPRPTQPAAVPTRPVPLPPAIQLQQQHPDWSVYYCQRILNGVISTGMTKEMVLTSWGEPRMKLSDQSGEFWSYEYFMEIGKMKLVNFASGIVTNITYPDIFSGDLDVFVGQSKPSVRLFFGDPSSVTESSAGDTWTYRRGGLLNGDYVLLNFTTNGTVSSWLRHTY